MDIKKVKELVTILEKSELNEIEVGDGKSSIRLVKQSQMTVPAQAVAPVAAPQPAALAAAAPEAAKPAAEESAEAGSPITSPMVGTFYRSPSPESAPFVTEGDSVKLGDVLCIIEAMKTMNKITSDKAGKIKSILAENGSAVEFGQKLFVIE